MQSFGKKTTCHQLNYFQPKNKDYYSNRYIKFADIITRFFGKEEMEFSLKKQFLKMPML